jgi:hypothetical protein
MRRGIVSDESEIILQDLSNIPNNCKNSGMELTHLFPLVHEAEAHNKKKLASLSGSLHSFTSEDFVENEYDRKSLENTKAVKLLQIKENCQVMLIKNLQQHGQGGTQTAQPLVNGSVGKVVRITDNTIYGIFSNFIFSSIL